MIQFTHDSRLVEHRAETIAGIEEDKHDNLGQQFSDALFFFQSL